VDDGKRPPTSGNATLALERGKTEMENLDDVRKCELEQIWAPFNVMWGYDPAQGSEFLGRRAAKYVADEVKDGHGVQENRESSRLSPKRSSKGPQSHPPSGTSSRSRRWTPRHHSVLCVISILLQSGPFLEWFLFFFSVTYGLGALKLVCLSTNTLALCCARFKSPGGLGML